MSGGMTAIGESETVASSIWMNRSRIITGIGRLRSMQTARRKIEELEVEMVEWSGVLVYLK